MRFDRAPSARFLFAPIDEGNRRDRLITALLIGLLCGFALWLRLSGLSLYHFSGDDCLHLETARLPTVGDLLSDLWTNDTHPPFYYLVLHFFFLWIPFSQPLVPKCLSLLVGVATVPASYFLGRAVSRTRAAGLLLAVLITVSGHLVLQSQTVRHYALLVLLQMLCLTAFFTPRHRRSAPYFVTAALIVCTHFIAALCVFATGIAGLFEDLRDREKAPRILTWLAAHALLGALFLAVLLPTQSVLHMQPQANNEYLGRQTIHAQGGLVHDLVQVLSGVHLALDGAWPWILLVPVALGTILALLRRAFTILIIAYLPLGLALILSAAGTYPIGAGRWCLWLVPGGLPILVFAVQDLKTRFGARAGIAALLAICGAIFVNLATAHGRSVLDPDAWRHSSSASYALPTRSDETELWRVLAKLDTPRSAIFRPIAQRKRMLLDRQLDWAPAESNPALFSCGMFVWEYFTRPQASVCVRELLRSAANAQSPYDWAWFINLPPHGNWQEILDVFAASPCLPIGTPRHVGAFLLIPIDLRALREPQLAQKCGLSITP